MLKINQAFKHFGMYFISVLDFTSTESIRSVNNQINLYAGLGPPEIQLIRTAAVTYPGPQMLDNQTFQGRSVNFTGTVKRTGGP